MSDNRLKIAVKFLREACPCDDAMAESVRVVLGALEAAGVVRPAAYPADKCERYYIEGRRSAMVAMATHFIRELRDTGMDIAYLRWYKEKQELIAVLRRVCAEHGDNDWPDDLHLGDVIEKHLERYLDACRAHGKEETDGNQDQG